MLEIHINTPKWADGCLALTVERVNTSPQTIYIFERGGLLILLSAKRIHDDPKKKPADVWLPIYGLSDIATFDADPLAPGSRTIDHLCLPETFAVVSQEKKTRRQVAVRVQVQIVEYYFPTEGDWRASEAQREQMLHQPDKRPTTLRRTQNTALEMLLPCLPRSACAAECTTPPLIVESEKTIVPDVYQLDKDWNDRGTMLAETLDQTHSACEK